MTVLSFSDGIRALLRRRSQRGKFDSLEEAKSDVEEYGYVARGPAGGFSAFKFREIPHGFHEGGDPMFWHREKVTVYYPPDFLPEPWGGKKNSEDEGA